MKYSSSNLYKYAEIFDVYEGEHIQEGFKSVAFHINLQDKNATLTEQIVEEENAPQEQEEETNEVEEPQEQQN